MYLCYFTFSGCLRNTYGENCSGTCPVNCLNDICDIISGTCFFCDTGFKGPRCENGLQNIDSFKYNKQNLSIIILMLYCLITRLFYLLLMTFMCINIFIWNLFIAFNVSNRVFSVFWRLHLIICWIYISKLSQNYSNPARNNTKNNTFVINMVLSFKNILNNFYRYFISTRCVL